MKEYNSGTQSGFTLLEVLVTLFIFSIGILGVNAMQLTSIQGNGRANRTSEASNIVSDQIERFLIADYDDSDLDDDGNQAPAVADGQAGLGNITVATADGHAVSGNYQIYWNVAADYPRTNTKTIRVIVDQPGAGANVAMEIVKARPL